MEKLLAIDASALLYRFFHALPPLTTPEGEPIQAIYGLTNVLLKISMYEGPKYIAAALDRPEPTFRKENFENYKSHRPKASNDLINQIKRMPDVFSLFGIKTLSAKGFEADDVLGTLAEKFKKTPELNIVIFTGDLDALQLIEKDKVTCRIIKTGVSEADIYDEKRVFERFGIYPKNLRDYKALTGDSSDNIPGIPGIGQKTAAELIKDFENIEGIYENLVIINSKVAKKLENKEKDALLYRDLVTIRRDVKEVEEIKLEELKTPPLDKENLKKYCEDMGFESLIKKLK
ncbi:MAG: hypothetical protein COU07_02050 [Candidatus Harrisonbacteria bacterium CG10_big_fil_rev_8_21_14_0_10_40_38]|uniref:5'-3' exonuclease domain-containing protein n=1 Tax=Candidatus Harrisonbacteria bacterium CG10_big_fil_rev_8_21_14_0_10_40_38 TaxID=1974583 RepID=A0A2H0US35_9BACT|nr:MAG: hypothetical protein COU07_02050 [Candidatus Harrisonbacteria bacterium CG10_big_fil_rev_8_21_14_0_10_40_38]